MIDLSFTSNVESLKAQLAGLRNSYSDVNAAATTANNGIANSETNIAQKMSIVKQEIADQKRLIKEMEQEEKKLEKQAAKTGTTQSREMKRVRNDLAVARAELDKMNKGLVQMNNEAKKSKGSFASFTKYAAGLLSVGLVVGAWKKVTEEADNAARAEQKLLFTLGQRKDLTAELLQQAAALQKTTRFDDDTTVEAQAQLAKFLGQNTEQIKILTPLVQDFATVYNMDLVSAAMLISKSIGSSTNMLGRYGIQIEKNISPTEKFKQIVEQLNKVVGGQSVAAAKVGLGAYKQWLNDVGNLFETVGSKVTGGQFFTILSTVTQLLNEKISPAESPDVKIINEIKKAAEKAEKPLWAFAKGVAYVNEQEIKNLEIQRRQAIADDDLDRVNKINEEIKKVREKIRVSTELANLPKKLPPNENVDDEDEEIEKTKTAYEQLSEKIAILNDELYNSVLMKKDDQEEIAKQIVALEKEKTLIEAIAKALVDVAKNGGALGTFTQKQSKGISSVLTWIDEPTMPDPLKKRNIGKAVISQGNKLWESLGFSSEKEYESTINTIEKGLDLITDGFSDVFAAQKEQADAVVAIYDRRVSSAESALQTELELQQSGYASNVKLKQQELDKLKEQREKAVQDQTEAAERQQAIETVIQAVNIATSISEIIKSSFKSAGIFGAILAPALIGGLFAIWKGSIAKVPASLPKYADGTLDTGAGLYRDSTGQRVAGVVHENETVTKKSLSRKYRKELAQIHNDIRPGYDPDKSKLLQSIDNSLKETITYEGGYKVIRRANRIKKVRL